jgi:hypothetical protein
MTQTVNANGHPSLVAGVFRAAIAIGARACVRGV